MKSKTALGLIGVFFAFVFVVLGYSDATTPNWTPSSLITLILVGIVAFILIGYGFGTRDKS